MLELHSFVGIIGIPQKYTCNGQSPENFRKEGIWNFFLYNFKY